MGLECYDLRGIGVFVPRWKGDTLAVPDSSTSATSRVVASECGLVIGDLHVPQNRHGRVLSSAAFHRVNDLNVRAPVQQNL